MTQRSQLSYLLQVKLAITLNDTNSDSEPDNLSQMVLSPVIGYIALRYNRAFLIGIGEIFLALSCLITAAPYFIYGPATHLIDDPGLLSSIYSNKTNFEMCAKDGHGFECKDGESNTVWLAVIIFFIGSFFKGIGYLQILIIVTQIITYLQIHMLLCNWVPAG